MGLKNKRKFIDILRADFNKMVEQQGQTVTFIWNETTGGIWNETYEIYEGGTVVQKQLAIKGVGKVVDYEEDQMETEYGRIDVGQCIVRFPHNTDFTQITDKDHLRFLYQGQKWKMDLPLGVGDMYGDEYYTKTIRGVKIND